MAKGYSHNGGIDYQKIFSHVVKHVSFKLLLSAVVHFDMEVQQMDVNMAFIWVFGGNCLYESAIRICGQ